MLPVTITKKWFTILHQHLLKFVWGNKKARCSFDRLCSPTNKGGLHFPNFHHYYLAMGTLQIRQWYISGSTKDWSIIEKELANSEGVNLTNLYYSKTCPKNLIGSPIETSFYILKSAQKSLSINSSLSINQSIWLNPNFTINNIPINWPSWKVQGIYKLKDIIHNNTYCGSG